MALLLAGVRMECDVHDADTEELALMYEHPIDTNPHLVKVLDGMHIARIATP